MWNMWKMFRWCIIRNITVLSILVRHLLSVAFVRKLSIGCGTWKDIALHDNLKPLECEFCGKRFSELLALKKHSITHSNNKQSAVIKCEICGKNFRGETAKEKHIKKYMEEIRQGKNKSCQNGFRCELCDYSVTHLSDLHRHIRIHTGEKPFQCEICGMCFSCPSNKNRYLKVHSGLKPYHCEVCGKSFTRESSRKRHMLELRSNNTWIALKQ